MSIYIPKSKLEQRLLDKNYYIADNSDTSPNYFDIVQFPDTVGGGKSLIVFRGNGNYLRIGSDIDVEILDVNGNPLYWEFTNLIDRFKQYYLSLYVYDVTADGIGTVIFTGEASRDLYGNAIPTQWINKHNVIWTKQINIKPLERNDSQILFDQPPYISVVQAAVNERVSSGSISLGTYTTTSAANQFTITTTNFVGFDKSVALDNGIEDLDLQKQSINPLQIPATTNNVDTTTRTPIKEGANAYKINKTNRFNTILKSSQPFFSASHIGGIFEISGSLPTTFLPNIPTGYVLSGSLASQLQGFYTRIVDVLDDKTALLEKPITVRTYRTDQRSDDLMMYNWTYSLISQSFGGRITFASTTPTYVTSSILANYIEFTYSDLNPIAGEIYKIRPFYRLSGRQGDYWLLNDQFVRPIEFLTDPAYPNQTTYAKEVSEYYLYGHFTDPGSSTSSGSVGYWDVLTETPTAIGSTYTPTITNNPQIASIQLQASQSNTAVFTTKNYQNYIGNRQYTISNYLTLDPGCELEVYMNSEPLQSSTIYGNSSTLAFNKTANLEKTRYSDAYSRFGKFVGKITNNTDKRLSYGKVGFDVLSDGDGLGRPLFRVKSINSDTTGSAYIGQVGVTATKLNGFTPNLVRFTIPFTQFPQVSLSQSLDFKLEYYDYTGNQSEYVTYLNGTSLNVTAQAVATGCQAESYAWSFDARTYHASTQSYTETVYYDPGGGFPAGNIDVPLYTYYTTASTADLILSASTTTRKWWPVIENLSGMYLSGSGFRTVPTYSAGTDGHITSYTQSYKFTTDFDIFGIRYSNSDVSLWNVRRPIIQDSNVSDSSYDIRFQVQGDPFATVPSDVLNGIIPVNSPGVYYTPSGYIYGTASIAHTNEYPPYTASSDPYWLYNLTFSQWYYYVPSTYSYGSWQGKITSSWNWVSAYTENFGNYTMPQYSNNTIQPANLSYIYGDGNLLADRFASYSAVTPLMQYSRSLQTSSIDNRWFAYEGCLGITRNLVSESFASYSRVGATNAQKTEALKKRRLMFPMNGTATGSYFTTNGGVYDVRFKVKQYGNYRPDTGSFMDVYIFNANADFTSETPGTAGWQPPAANIVKIGNGYGTLPVLSNYDPTTGAYFDEYHITLVQYGTPAQIVFEASGDVANNKYFGTLIDDVSFCKIGVTTDPALVGASSVYDTWTQINAPTGTPATGDLLTVLRGGSF